MRSRVSRKMRGVGLVSGVVNKVRAALKRIPPDTLKDIGVIAKIALGAARRAVGGAGGKSAIRIPRALALPKRGGFLPLLPLLGALGGVGSLAGGVSGLIKAIRDIRSGTALRNGGRIGRRVYMKPYKKGYGLYLEPYKGQFPWSGI